MKIPFTNYNLSFTNFDKKQPNKANIAKTITYQQPIIRVRQDATKFKIALQSAESIYYPNRYLLYQMYASTVLDGQVSAAMLQRKAMQMSKQFHIKNKDGEIDEEKTKYFKTKWFKDYLDLAIDSDAYGFSLIQFGSIVNDQFTSVELVPRIYVRPELDIVISNTASFEGQSFLEKPYSNWCVGIGRKYNLGYLMKCAPLVIFKINAMSAWAEFNQVFGSPLRVGKTDVRDKETRDNMINMFSEMGNATSMVLDTNDMIEFVETNRSDAFQVYNMMVDRCNSEIAKIILGQTGTLDEKAYSGSSKVHEGVAESIMDMDLQTRAFEINTQLIPLMKEDGYVFNEGDYFDWDNSEDLGLETQAKIDASFMPYMKFNQEYLENKYGIKLDEVNELDEAKEASEAIKNFYK